jgi:hypothetical protein
LSKRKSEKAKVQSETITVYVNHKPKRLFIGLKVKHAIGPRWTRRVREHRAMVRDADGNGVDVDGALYDGERLQLAPMDPTTFADEVQRQAT